MALNGAKALAQCNVESKNYVAAYSETKWWNVVQGKLRQGKDYAAVQNRKH
jgi:hypothetical protein